MSSSRVFVPFLNIPLSAKSTIEIENEPYTLEEFGEIIQLLKNGNQEYAVWMVVCICRSGLRSIKLRESHLGGF